ncbi:transposase, partial [Candidatus Poribacteria bacterium]|nr:transposase [Candidatus Poribacteria bacterium]
IPRGLIIFDRGFNRRKVFACVLKAGHHLLCRAKSNAVFYRQADVPKCSKRGRPKKYGKRIHLPYLRYDTIDIDNKRYKIASVEALTKMCPHPVRLVVIRTRPKKAKPFRYFCIYTTDLNLDLSQIVRYYQKRWTIETAFRDVKQHLGFDQYRVKSKKSINRWVQLSFTAVCLTQWVFTIMANTNQQITVERVCRELGIDWYRPKKLTRGLMLRYLRALMVRRLFSATTVQKSKSPNIQQASDIGASTQNELSKL